MIDTLKKIKGLIIVGGTKSIKTKLDTFSMNHKTEEEKHQRMEHVYRIDNRSVVKLRVDYKLDGRSVWTGSLAGRLQ